MRTLENALRRVGFCYVAGADEVGERVEDDAVSLDDGGELYGRMVGAVA